MWSIYFYLILSFDEILQIKLRHVIRNSIFNVRLYIDKVITNILHLFGIQ